MFFGISIHRRRTCFLNMIPFTPVHSAVLMMAPKFLASEIWSESKQWFYRFNTVSIKVSKSKKRNRRDVTRTLMVIWVNLFSFSTGTYEKLMFPRFITFIKSFISSCCFFEYRHLLLRLLDTDNRSYPKYLMFFSMVQIYKKPPQKMGWF
jgi:hypothetical protein